MGIGLAPCSLQDDGGLRLALYGGRGQLAGQKREEVVVYLLVCLLHRVGIQGQQVEVVEDVGRKGGYLRALALGFTQALILLEGFLMQVGKSTLLHRRSIGVERAACQQGQAHKQGGDVGGDVATAAHAFVPAPGAVFALQFLQADKSREGEVALAVGIEQLYETLHALRVRSGFGQPGRFAQQHIFYILILLQTAEESFLALPAGLPSLDDFADAGLRLGDGGGQGIGIIGYGP